VSGVDQGSHAPGGSDIQEHAHADVCVNVSTATSDSNPTSECPRTWL
jgi:hypothetical protein